MCSKHVEAYWLIAKIKRYNKVFILWSRQKFYVDTYTIYTHKYIHNRALHANVYICTLLHQPVPTTRGGGSQSNWPGPENIACFVFLGGIIIRLYKINPFRPSRSHSATVSFQYSVKDL